MKRHASTNRLYRLLWSYAAGMWVAVAETARKNGKSCGARRLLPAVLLLCGPLAYAAPGGGQVTSGSGSISQSGDTTTIVQGSAHLALSWKGFDIAAQETVNFLQPSASAIAINRISDTNGSQILGHLNANGQIYLVNPNGILFGKGAQVNVGGLVASTLDVSDRSMDGPSRSFSGDSSASVVNAGTITSSAGGYVALVGNHVSNQGTITAQMGTVALAAGSATTLTFSGNSLLHLQVDQSVVTSAAENGGLMRADGGQVIMTAGAKNSLLASVVNNSGAIEAHTMQNQDGNIVLLGGMQAGQATVDGTLDASSGSGSGGRIVVTAKDVSLGDGASVQATGATGGGTIAIGGGWESGGGIDQATRVYVAQTATLNASATGNGSGNGKGDGGTISVRSDVDNPDSTARIYGKLFAKAATQGGNGGRIETSGRWLDVDGSTIDASAAHGAAGQWLLDPWNVVIGATGTDVSGNQFVPTADSNITASSINTALNAGNNVIIYTGTTGSTSLGDITVNAAISKSSGAASVLVLQAADSIIINQPITNTSAAGRLDLDLDADNQGGVHDGVGAVILNNTITTKGGYIKFGDGATMTLNGVANTEVGGDVYVGGSSAVGLSTGGGLIAVHGQLIIANPSGLTVNSANGNVNFDGLVDSGDAYAFVTTTGTWGTALTAAKSGLGANLGDTYLATITSRLENSVAGATAGYVASWLGGRRVTTINAANDPVWRWVTGPEGAANGGTGTPFFTQNGSDTTQGTGGSAISGAYTNWNSGEPNNFNGTNLSTGGTGESVMQFVGTQGQWNDLSLTATTLGYVKETNLAPSGLTVSGGTGAVTFSKAIGSNKPVSLLSVTGATIALPSPAVVNTTGTQTFVGQVSVGGTNVNLLTVSGNNLSTTYGAGVPALTPTYSGFVNGDTAASLTTAATVTTTASAQPNVGSYVTTPSGAVDASYFILYNPGTLIVNPATLTITANSASKIYNQANPALTVGYAGFMYTDTTASLIAAATATTTAVTASNVGAYPITPAGAVTTANYSAVYVNGTLTVNPVTLTVSGLSGTSRAYNGSLVDALSGAGTLTGLVAGQTLTLGNTNATLGSANVGSQTVTSALTLVSGTGLAGNYVLTQPTLANVTISRAPLTLSGLSGTARPYNSSNVDALTGTGTLAGLVNGETLTLGGTANGTLGSANAGSEPITTAITLGDGSGLASNYLLTQPTLANVAIGQAALTVSGLSGTSRTYNGSVVDALTGTGVLSGLLNSETLTLGSATNGTLGSANAGSEPVTTALTLVNGSGLAANYALTQPTLANVTIAQAPLTLSGLSGTARPYNASAVDALTGTGVLAGLVNGETLTLGGTANGTLGSANAGSEPITTAITLANGTGLAANYVITQPTLANVTIAQAALTVSGLTGTSRAYDGTLIDALSGSGALSGLVGGQTLTLANVSGTLGGANVGSQTVTSALTLVSGTGLAGNYVLTQPTLANVTISRAPLSISGLSGTARPYNTSTLDALTGTGVLAGLVSGETLSLGGTASGTLGSANAGSEPITTAITLADGSGLASNYLLTQPTLANVAIGQAALTVSGLSGTGRLYNASVVDALAGTGVLSGLLNGETLTLAGATNGTLGSANAGSEPVTTALTLVNGTGVAANYLLTQPTLANVTIGQAPLTVSGLSGTARPYNASTVDALTGTGTLAGLVGGETLALGGVASGTLGSADAGSEPITTAITLVNGTGLAANYVLTQPILANVNIARAPLTVSGLSGTSRAYDGTLVDALTGNGALTGLVGGQTLTLGNVNGTLASANAGSESVSANMTLGDGTGLAINYLLTQPTLANVTITPATLTVSGLSGTGRTYNASTIDALAGTGALSGLFNGDTLVLAGATTGTLSSADAGSRAVSTTMTLANGTGLAANYALIQPTLGNVTITPAALTLSGLLGTDRTYNGSTIDALTGTGTLTGLFGGQTLSLVGASNGTLASADAGSEALTTSISLGDGTGLASNYLLTQPTLPNVTISRAPLTVSGAMAADKVYDGTTSATLTGTLSGLFGADAVTLLPTGSFGSKDVGTGIVVTPADTLGGAAALNYTLTQPTGLAASITPLAITVSAAGVNKIYDGGLNAAATLSSAGIIVGDTVTFGDTSALFDNKNVGVGKAVAISGISALGAQAFDYTVSNTTASTIANITQLGSVAWIGPATGGSWSNPANWAGGAIPDLSNVANVAIPIGNTVIFDAGVAGPVNLNQLGSGGLTVNSGLLNIASALNLTNFAQSGGTIGGTGSFTVSNSFSQSSGQIAMGEGAISISQASGNLSFANLSGGSVILNSPLGAVMLGNLMASGNLVVAAAGGDITQSPGTSLTVGGTTGVAASVAGAPANISLENAGNRYAQAVSASGLQVGLTAAGPLTLGVIQAVADLNLAASGGLDLGTATIGGNLVANSANGNVTQDGALSVAGTTHITAGTGNVQLNNAGNQLVHIVTTTGQLVALTNAAPLLLGTVVTGGNLNLHSNGALNLGSSTVGGNLTANSGNGNITQDGPISVGGTTDIVAGTGTVQLNNPGNVFQGVVTTSGSEVAIGGERVPTTLRASISAAVSQLQSGVLWSEPDNPPDALSLSPTVNETRDGERVQVTMNIGTAGPQLRIVAGGMRLPDNTAGVVRAGK